MEIINLSDNEFRITGNKVGLLKIIVLPDYCPGRWELPTGIIAVYDRNKHEISADYLGPDVGCGMVLAKFLKQPLRDLEYTAYKVAAKLRAGSTEIGSLGSGNHFIDIFEAGEVDENLGINKGEHLALIHSGTRKKGQDTYEKRISGEKYVIEHENLINFGRNNRRNLLNIVEKCTENKLKVIWDKPHNILELYKDRVIYKKGAINLKPKEIAIIPSSMTGEAVIVRGKESLKELEYSICHGTGRKISRRDAKNIEFNSDKIREKICIPTLISQWEMRTEAPYCYRTIKEILPKIEKYVEVIGRLIPKAFIC